jgi:hypothetical protein
LVGVAKTALGTATDEGVDTLLVGSGVKAHLALAAYYFRDDDRPVDSL